MYLPEITQLKYFFSYRGCLSLTLICVIPNNFVNRLAPISISMERDTLNSVSASPIPLSISNCDMSMDVNGKCPPISSITRHWMMDWKLFCLDFTLVVTKFLICVFTNARMCNGSPRMFNYSTSELDIILDFEPESSRTPQECGPSLLS